MNNQDLIDGLYSRLRWWVKSAGYAAPEIADEMREEHEVFLESIQGQMYDLRSADSEISVEPLYEAAEAAYLSVPGANNLSRARLRAAVDAVLVVIGGQT